MLFSGAVGPFNPHVIGVLCSLRDRDKAATGDFFGPASDETVRCVAESAPIICYGQRIGPFLHDLSGLCAAIGEFYPEQLLPAVIPYLSVNIFAAFRQEEIKANSIFREIQNNIIPLRSRGRMQRLCLCVAHQPHGIGSG